MLLIYQEKFWFRANEPFRGLFGPKMTDSCNCRSVIKIMLKFCTMKESKTCMKAILFNFLKKNLLLGKWAIMDPIWKLK